SSSSSSSVTEALYPFGVGDVYKSIIRYLIIKGNDDLNFRDLQGAKVSRYKTFSRHIHVWQKGNTREP
ncbi:MAG: hypothetical protein VYC76_06570, partial [Pseudomonadota bacterium]|nr:hypothetical protein [Pseudomonadota bacterium]